MKHELRQMRTQGSGAHPSTLLQTIYQPDRTPTLQFGKAPTRAEGNQIMDEPEGVVADDRLLLRIEEAAKRLGMGVSDERCKWPNTLSCGLAGRVAMTETLVGVSPPSLKDPADPPSAEELAAAKELVRQARAQGVALTGPGGLLKALTKTLETALEEELAEHLGYDKHDPVGRNRGNSRNGKRAKTVLTDSGEVAVEVPRDRDGSFEPVIVAKRQRRLSSIDEIVLSLYARGLTTGDIAAHFAEIYDAQVSKDTISRITDRVVEEMQAWTSRPLERVYAAVVLDAINVKVRDGQVANRPVYAAIGVDLEGQKDILGMWFGDGGGESAKFWMVVLTELRNRGVADVFFLVCDGLKGLPDSVAGVALPPSCRPV